VAELVLLS